MERRVFKEALPPAYRIAYIIVAVLCVLCAWLKLMALAMRPFGSSGISRADVREMTATME